MYQQRMHVRLFEQGFDADAALVYEGEWLTVPHVGHEILINAGSGRTLWVVEGVRHVVGMDGRAQYADLRVRKAG